MKSSIIEKKLNFKINNENVNIKFHIYCHIIVTSIYNNDNILIHQFVLEPNKFWNYEECKHELQYIIYDYVAADFNLPRLDKLSFLNVNNYIVNNLSETINDLLYRIKTDTDRQGSNQLGDYLTTEDTHINLLLDFINLKEDYINLKEKCNGQED